MVSRICTLLLISILGIACGESSNQITVHTVTPDAQIQPKSTPRNGASYVATVTLNPDEKPKEIPYLIDSDISVPPETDMFALAQRLALKSRSYVDKTANSGHVDYEQGRKDTFKVLDVPGRKVYEVTATLQLVTDHAYWYVDDNVTFTMSDLEESAKIYEWDIYPRITRVLGRELVPGIDNDVHLTILHAPLKGVAGYYSSMDEYPVQVYPLSNEREMIYLDTHSLTINSYRYLGTLAHEFTHAIQFRADPTEDSWINEGVAEYGKGLAGFVPDFHNAFLASNPVSLINWPDLGGGSPKHYGAASLFVDYLAGQYGIESIRLLIDEQADNIEGVDEYLKAMKAEKNFRDVFADWLIANYIDDANGGIYSYPTRVIQRPVSEVIEESEKISRKMPQYAGRYYDLQFNASETQVVFKGHDHVRLIFEDPPDGVGCWWSNRGDSINTKLTGQFRLPEVSALTFEYSLWYNIENGWDIVYVEVSTDGGMTWDILTSRSALHQGHFVHAFGPGYTGSSDGWFKDSVDLTSYAGHDVHLRFEYVTDGAIHGPGLCVTNIAIPEAGLFYEPFDGNQLWEAQGFVAIVNREPQSFVLRVIELGSEVRVRNIPLDKNQSAIFSIYGLGSSLTNAVIVVAGTANWTMMPAQFELEAFVVHQ
jgi:immune inhibitor A